MGEKKKNKLTNKLEGRLRQETSLNQFKVNSQNFNILGKRFRTAIKLTPNCPWGMEAIFSDSLNLSFVFLLLQMNTTDLGQIFQEKYNNINVQIASFG